MVIGYVYAFHSYVNALYINGTLALVSWSYLPEDLTNSLAEYFGFEFNEIEADKKWLNSADIICKATKFPKYPELLLDVVESESY